MDTHQFTAVIAAAGIGARAGLGYNKLLYQKDGETVVKRTLDRFAMPKVLVVSTADRAAMETIAHDIVHTTIVTGGDTRAASVQAGLAAVKTKYVLIHDGARPFVKAKTVDALMRAALAHGSAIPYRQSSDTVRLRDGDKVTDLNRADVMLISTPQVFETEKLKEAYRLVTATATDDAAVYAAAGFKPYYLEVTDPNPKLTTAEDFAMFDSKAPDYRIGHGYDVHAFEAGRRLVLGGVTIPSDGLRGHSDADVLAHAVMDALLSAAGEPDIGTLFPDTDPAYLNADSMKLLARVHSSIGEKGYTVVNVSAVVHAQAPKLAPYVASMCQNLATALSIDTSCVGISATTWEQLGHIGRREGIAVSVSCLLCKQRMR